ncbi:hypothetical protein NHQ30_009272 [Ciborinia camelliae]|nr:hypothetical protein NHQ30_009272 [Ciborinia camelliae]
MLSNSTTPLFTIEAPDKRYTDLYLEDLPRDPPIEDRVWLDPTKHLTDQRVDAKPSFGEDRICMMFYEAPQGKEKFPSLRLKQDGTEYTTWYSESIYLNEPFIFKDGLPYSKDSKTLIPINVKLSDSVLGSVWQSAPESANLHDLWPADLQAKGTIYPDRKPCGRPFLPRLNKEDYPYHGSLVRDGRIGCIDIRALGDPTQKKTIALGGDYFNLTKDTLREYTNNDHHYFVTLKREEAATYDVYSHPVERHSRRVQNCSRGDLTSFRQPHLLSMFQTSLYYMPPSVQKQDKALMDRMTQEEVATTLQLVPTRGLTFKSDNLPWDILLHIFTGYVLTESAYDRHFDLLGELIRASTAILQATDIKHQQNRSKLARKDLATAITKIHLDKRVDFQIRQLTLGHIVAHFHGLRIDRISIRSTF